MKAVICHAFGPVSDLTIEEIDPPVAGPGEITIRVEACGVNFYDGLAVQGKYQTKPDFPFSPGGEVAGTVSALGDDVRGFDIGQRVMAFTGFGGYAQAISVAAGNVFPIAGTMDFEVAAGFLIAYATSHHALKDRAALKPGETLLVLGASGGVGLAAVQIGKAMGARVIAAASTDEKLAVARTAGADDAVNYKSEELRARLKDLTEGRGVDVVYDPVGGAQAELALRSLATGGRHLVIGFASGDIPELAFNRLLLKQISVTGVLWGAFARAQPAANAANIAELLDWHRSGKIAPQISQTCSLERFGDALESVMNRAATGKVVIRPFARETEQSARVSNRVEAGT